MALFTILEPPGRDPDRVAVIKDGFSAGALVFTVLWALRYRMWVTAAVLLALFVATGLLVDALGISPFLGSVFEAAIGLVFGFEAQRLRIMSLQAAGYRTAGTVEASRKEAAELKYFMGRSKPETPSTTSRMRVPSAHDTLGLFGNV